MPALSDTPVTDTAQMTPAERARAAAVARAAGPSTSSSSTSPATSTAAESHSSTLTSENFSPSRADQLPFHKLLDGKLLPDCSKPHVVQTLSTLLTLLSNILSPPNPGAANKYRQLRLSNSLIRTNLVSPANGVGIDFLIAAGFRSQKIEFEEYLVFSPGPTAAMMHRLRTAEWVVREKLKAAKEAEEREKRYRESEKTAEAGRKEKALLAAEEDRLRRAEKDEREKFARSARPPPSSSSAGTPSYTVRSTSPGRWARQQARQHHHQGARDRGSGGRGQPYPPRSGGGMGGGGNVLTASLGEGDEDDDEEMEEDDEGEEYQEGEEEEDPPPSYGELHGRVLATGLPPGGEAEVPRGVSMVSRQDLEE